MKTLIKSGRAAWAAIAGLVFVLIANLAIANELGDGPNDTEIVDALQRQMPVGIAVSGIETLAQEAGGSVVKPVVSKRIKVNLIVEEELFGMMRAEKHLNGELIRKVLAAGASDEGYVITISRLRGAAWETDIEWDGLPNLFKLRGKPRTQFSDAAIVFRSPEHVKLETEYQNRRLEILKAYAGEWVGHYSCGAGPKTRARITIALPEVWEQKEVSFDERPPEMLSATFAFSDTWVRPRFSQGSYQGNFSVSLDDQTGHLRGTQWVSRPRGFDMVHPTFRITGEQLSVNLNHRSCGPLMLYRADSPPASVQADLQKVESAISAFSKGDTVAVFFGSDQMQHDANMRIDQVGPGYIKGVISHGMIGGAGNVVESERVETMIEVHFPAGAGSQFVNVKQLVRGDAIIPGACRPVAAILTDGRIRIAPSTGACGGRKVILTSEG